MFPFCLTRSRTATTHVLLSLRSIHQVMDVPELWQTSVRKKAGTDRPETPPLRLDVNAELRHDCQPLC